jgi:thioesterase-3
MQSELFIEVLPEHTDEIGHLNHVQALEFLQRGRIDLYAGCGLRTRKGVERFGTVVVNLNVNFRKECFLGEALRVVTRTLALGRKSFKVVQEIRRPEGTVAVEGIVTSVVMDMGTRATIGIPEWFAEKFPGSGPGG